MSHLFMPGENRVAGALSRARGRFALARSRRQTSIPDVAALLRVQFALFRLAIKRYLVLGAQMQQAELRFQKGKIVRGQDPLNLEMPFENLDGVITATESFYVRTHFPIPKIDKDKW